LLQASLISLSLGPQSYIGLTLRQLQFTSRPASDASRGFIVGFPTLDGWH
jgi:hypothetical protein